MSAESKRIVDKAWNFATVLWHDGVPFLSYAEEITFLLFLKMADERAIELPKGCDWPTLRDASGTALIRPHSR